MQNATPFEPQKSRYSGGNLVITLIIAVLLAYLAWRLISYTGKPAAEPIADSAPTAIGLPGIATTVATYTSGKHPCTAINEECGDKTTWRAWPDVDQAALASGANVVLNCAHVFVRYDTGAGYDMNSATHTQIAMWFSLSKSDRVSFLNDCQTK